MSQLLAQALTHLQPPLATVDVETVPFVEMFAGRLQGVVASDSDPARVYVCFVEAETGNYYSQTNNNRPDAGMTKRIRYLVEGAIERFGEERVARFLNNPRVLTVPKGRPQSEHPGAIFSRFLEYLQTLECQARAEAVPEMAWFV